MVKTIQILTKIIQCKDEIGSGKQGHSWEESLSEAEQSPQVSSSLCVCHRDLKTDSCLSRELGPDDFI